MRLTPRKDVRENITFSEDWQTNEICEKCCVLEDILEKYHIEDAKQLENVLSMHISTCENLTKMTHRYEKERRNGKTLELLKQHIMYCRDVDCFVFINIDLLTKKKLERWLLS